jgi:hypothetical protein
MQCPCLDLYTVLFIQNYYFVRPLIAEALNDFLNNCHFLNNRDFLNKFLDRSHLIYKAQKLDSITNIIVR